MLVLFSVVLIEQWHDEIGIFHLTYIKPPRPDENVRSNCPLQIRLRAVEPLAEHEKNYKKRFQKILEPLTAWVHPASVILTDLTVDKGTLLAMGFKNVYQASAHSDASNARNSNANIMEYLRRIVPRMFQNTLSLLSRQIIQQFLDELVWRER